MKNSRRETVANLLKYFVLFFCGGGGGKGEAVTIKTFSLVTARITWRRRASFGASL